MNEDVIALKRRLKEVYKAYGFTCSENYISDNILVFTLKTGYFDNADIVPFERSFHAENAFQELSKVGYACTIREFLTVEQAESELFKGFFSLDSILDRLKSNYSKFTHNIVSAYSDNATYQYVNAPYFINGLLGESNPAEEVLSRINAEKPTLFLIEAAAGYGKTCSAYELVNKLTEQGDFLPLFSELSRNRQAAIFRYILLDEIARTFPTLSSNLVQKEMKNGRIITILDGFDELLRKNEEGGEFENHEPMLDTIGQFLTGRAKIVLTTRRTVLFEGDAFHSWVEDNHENFVLIKIKINEPKIVDWLPSSRLSELQRNGFPVEHIANPVLLSYLRCISDADFSDVVSNPQELVQRYFNFMLTREQTRQDLHITPEGQLQILQAITDDMVTYGYTSESRDYIIDLIASTNSKLIDESLTSYSPSERPTKEQLVNKLASHALLDRNTREPDKIGFVNEFVFGHFIADVILSKPGWINDDLRFIEPAVISYQPRVQTLKDSLWDKLSDSLDFLSIGDRIDVSIKLKGAIDFELVNGEAQGLEISDVKIGENKISDFQFNECIFKSCCFDFTKMSNVTFLNCKYYGNTSLNETSLGAIHELGGAGDQGFIELLSNLAADEEIHIQPDRQLLLDRFVLEKFWPTGKDNVLYKHRPIKMIVTGSGEFKSHEIMKTIVSLKRRGFLSEPAIGSFVEFNFDKLIEIRNILEK